MAFASRSIGGRGAGVGRDRSFAGIQCGPFRLAFRFRLVLSANGHGHDQLPSVVVESRADRCLLPVPAVAFHGRIPLPCGQSGAVAVLGVHRGDAGRSVRDRAAGFGRCRGSVPASTARGAEGRGVWALSVSCLVLGLLLVVLDSRMAGLGWRYITDFGWLFALAALPALSCILDVARPRLRWLARAGFLALLLFMIVITLLSLFMPGRDDELLRNNPGLFLDVQSWFSML